MPDEDEDGRREPVVEAQRSGRLEAPRRHRTRVLARHPRMKAGHERHDDGEDDGGVAAPEDEAAQEAAAAEAVEDGHVEEGEDLPIPEVEEETKQLRLLPRRREDG